MHTETPTGHSEICTSSWPKGVISSNTWNLWPPCIVQIGWKVMSWTVILSIYVVLYISLTYQLRRTLEDTQLRDLEHSQVTEKTQHIWKFLSRAGKSHSLLIQRSNKDRDKLCWHCAVYLTHLTLSIIGVFKTRKRRYSWGFWGPFFTSPLGEGGGEKGGNRSPGSRTMCSSS